MSAPVVFTSFVEWADQAGLSDEEREAHALWGATVGRDFDTGAMRRHMAKLLAERAERAVEQAAEFADSAPVAEQAERQTRSLRPGWLAGRRVKNRRRKAPQRPPERRKAL